MHSKKSLLKYHFWEECENLDLRHLGLNPTKSLILKLSEGEFLITVKKRSKNLPINSMERDQCSIYNIIILKMYIRDKDAMKCSSDIFQCDYLLVTSYLEMEITLWNHTIPFDLCLSSSVFYYTVENWNGCTLLDFCCKKNFNWLDSPIAQRLRRL